MSNRGAVALILSVRKRSLASLWRHPDFLKFWIGETISLIGSQVTLIALPLTALYTLHASMVQVGLLNGVATVPSLLFGLFVGARVDRRRRLPVLIGASLGRAVLLAAIPVAALLHLLRLYDLYVVAFLTGFLSMVSGAAYQPYLPTLVRPDQLVEGNSKMEVSRAIARVSGPSLGGVAVGLVGAPMAIALDALSYLASALSLRAIRTPERTLASPPQPQSVWRDIGEGLRLVLGNPLLRAIAGQTGTGIFVSTISTTVYLLYVTRELGFTPLVLGILLAIGGVGALVGSLVAAPITRRFGVGPTIIWTQLLTGLSALLVPLAGRGTGMAALVAFLLLAAAQALQGILIVIYDVNWISLLQTVVPGHMQGRVNATLGVLIWSLQPVGAVLAGVLATLIGLRLTLLLAAVGWSLVVLWPLCSPLRTLRTLSPPPEPATALLE